jgi:AcrR family transcriptional regulator
MKAKKRQGLDTKERLLEAACEVFSKKGYRAATTADICQRARANVAAVNYHFGNKQKLYVEAWRGAFGRSLEAHPADGGVSREAPAEVRLYGRILGIVQRFADPENHEFAMLHKEMANPTGLLGEVMRKSIEPLRQELRSIVRELLGEGAREEQVMLCQMSIRAQCLDMVFRRQHQKMLSKAGIEDGPGEVKPGVDEIAEHITRFSLAGIRATRREIEGGKDGERTRDIKRTGAMISSH